MKPRCFLLEPTRLDISSAYQFGEIWEVFDGTTYRNSVYDPSPAVERDIVGSLTDMGFDSDNDRVILAGNVAMLVRATAAIVSKWGAFNAVLFDNALRSYVLIKIGDKVTV